MRPEYRHRITPEDVGRRVTVRRWVPDDERGQVPSDVVGRLVSWEDDRLEVERRDGERVVVPVEDVLASKVVPER